MLDIVVKLYNKFIFNHNMETRSLRDTLTQIMYSADDIIYVIYTILIGPRLKLIRLLHSVNEYVNSVICINTSLLFPFI